MKKTILIKSSILIIATFVFLGGFGTDCLAADYKLLEVIPGIDKSPTFPEYVTGIYKFAIVIVAIAALLMLSIGGFAYMASAGNQAQAGTAKKIITDALLGLVVVFLSWLVLYTINPDLLGANPGMGGMNIGVQRSAVSTGKAVQKDVHCKADGTGCKDSLEECKIAHGEGVCVRRGDAIDKNKYYGMDGVGGDATAYDSKAECYASGEIYCTNGSRHAAALIYGVEHTQKEIKLESTNKIDIQGANLTDVSDENITDLQTLASELDRSKLFIYTTEDDGKRINIGRNSELIKYARSHDAAYDGPFGSQTADWSWGKDSSTGDWYYKITEGPSKGAIVIRHKTGNRTSILLPKNDGSEYTLEGLKLENNISNEASTTTPIVNEDEGIAA